MRGAMLVLGSALLFAASAAARDSLGLAGQWGAFRDAASVAEPRCYAIAMPTHGTGGARTFTPYADVSVWPKRGIAGAVHFRLPRAAAAGSDVALEVGNQPFALLNGGAEAWAADRTMDAALVAAMRSAPAMTLAAHDAAGRRFSETWELAGTAAAIDSALVGCAKMQ